MTIESSLTKVKREGNGSGFTFSFSPLIIYKTTDLVVVLTDDTGVDTTLTEGTGPTNYSVQAVAGSNYPSATGATGQITYPADSSTALATNNFLTIKKVLPLEQKTDLETQGGYFPDVQETQFDKNVGISIQQQEDIDRAIKGPISDDNPIGELPNATTRASKFLAFDASGDPIEATTITTSPVTAFMATVLDDTTAAAARTTLDAQEDLITTRGDLVVGNATPAASRLALGAANRVLRSDGTDAVWGQVQTADIADDAVTLAKIAAGTDGELITWDASGNPAAVAVGTAGHVLTSNGVGAAPTFQVVADQLGWTFVEEVTPTSGTSIAFTQNDDFANATEIMFTMKNLSMVSASGSYRMNLHESGTIQQAANTYGYSATRDTKWLIGGAIGTATLMDGWAILRKLPFASSNEYGLDWYLRASNGSVGVSMEGGMTLGIGFTDMDNITISGSSAFDSGTAIIRVYVR